MRCFRVDMSSRRLIGPKILWNISPRPITSKHAFLHGGCISKCLHRYGQSELTRKSDGSIASGMYTYSPQHNHVKTTRLDRLRPAKIRCFVRSTRERPMEEIVGIVQKSHLISSLTITLARLGGTVDLSAGGTDSKAHSRDSGLRLSPLLVTLRMKLSLSRMNMATARSGTGRIITRSLRDSWLYVHGVGGY